MRPHFPVIITGTNVPDSILTCSCGTWRIDEESLPEHMREAARISKLDDHSNKRSIVPPEALS